MLFINIANNSHYNDILCHWLNGIILPAIYYAVQPEVVPVIVVTMANAALLVRSVAVVVLHLEGKTATTRRQISRLLTWTLRVWTVRVAEAVVVAEIPTWKTKIVRDVRCREVAPRPSRSSSIIQFGRIVLLFC